MTDLCPHKQMINHCSFCRDEEAAERLKQLRRDHEGTRPATTIGDIARQLQQMSLRIDAINQELVGLKNMMTRLLAK